jgi:ferrous iron transport protein B
MSYFEIGVVGNPNCGKTTLFNALTGARQRVGNWPGVTVERKIGEYKQDNYDIKLVDLPGIYSLDVMPGTTSLDEKITQDYMLSGEAQLIVNIIDASNLERNLYLTTQLLEMGIPMVVVLNMMDIAEQRGIQIDVPTLSKQLGTSVVPVVASSSKGISELKKIINHAAEMRRIPLVQVAYPDTIEKGIANLLPIIREELPENKKAPFILFL